MTSRFASIVSVLTLTVLLLGAPSRTAAQPSVPSPPLKEIKVLGIGNSFTVNAFTYLEPMGTSSQTCRLTLGRAVIGGCSMEKHMRLAKLHDAEPDHPEGKPYWLQATDKEGRQTKSRAALCDMLKSDKWDIVTIQQLSAQSPDTANYRPYAKELHDYIKKYAPQAEVVLHQTWAYRTDGDFDRVFRGKPGYGQKEMYRDLNEAYNTIAQELGVRLIPVGAAFQLAREIRPYIPDDTTDTRTVTPPQLPKDKNSLCVGYRWKKSDPPQLSCDTHHAGAQGEYLAAAVWFEFLTGSNPCTEGIRVGSLSEEDTRFLSGIAHQVVAEGKRPSLE